jgi:hypothetical protein
MLFKLACILVLATSTFAMPDIYTTGIKMKWNDWGSRSHSAVNVTAPP